MKSSARNLIALCAISLAILAGLSPKARTAAQESSSDTNQAAPAPLQVQRFPGYFHYNEPLTPDPVIVLRFSAPVALESVREAVAFLDRKGGRRLAAKVSRPEAGVIAPLQPWGDQGERLDWPAEHFVSLEPVASLPTDLTWQLRLDASLRSADGERGLGQDWMDTLGTLHAFKVASISASNDYDSPRMIQIRFNKPLDTEVTEEVLPGYFGIQPIPDRFRVERGQSFVRLHGDFQFGRDYTVSVSPGLLGHDETRLESEERKTVKFSPNAGFISLPAFSQSQNASGARRFDVLTGNLKSVRVRVKQLNGRDLAYALRGYEELYGGHGDKQTIPFEMVPGKTIHDREFTRTAEIDHTEKLTLNWEEILGAEPHAALYVCAEGWSDTRKDLGIGAQALIQLTDIGLAWKRDREGTLIYAFSLKSGKPLARLDLETLDEEAETLETFRTDDEGIARIPADRMEPAKWLGASRGKDRHLVEKFGRYDAIGLWQFSIPYRYDDLSENDRRVLLFTDRDVYQPGETAYLKGMVRLTDGDRLLPMARAAGKIRVKVTDSRGRGVLTREITLSERGGFDLAIEIPDEKTLGWYSVEVDFNEPGVEVEQPWRHQYHHGFQVAEYRPNTFEIAIDTEGRDPEAREFSLPVSANYFMGKPLSQARLNWYVSTHTVWPMVRGFEDFRFGGDTGGDAGFSASETLTLGADGTGRIDVRLPEPGDAPAPVRVSVNAEITDLNQQTITESTAFTLDSSDFYLGVRTPEGITRAGEETTLALAVASPDGTVHAGPVETTMTVERLTHTTVKVKGAGGRVTTRNETEVTEVLSRGETVETRLQAETGLPLADEVPLTLAEAGDYRVTFSARDQSGREARTRVDLRIVGAEAAAWSWHDGNRIDVTPDRESYAVGDTARLLVRSPVFGHALLTMERGGVRETRALRISEHETVVEVPIGEGGAPNLFASVLIVRGSADSPHAHPNTDYRLGYCQLMVDDPAAELRVAIERDPAPYQLPGAEVTLGARLTDHRGAPVADAEVVLYAVDEGVLSITGYQTPDPAAVFHAPFPLAVHTGQTISDLLPEDPAERHFANKGYVIGGGGEFDGMDPRRVRKNFQALAFWRGALITDAEGRVTTTFTAPDNLTSFRVMAVAAAEHRFGSAEDRLIINKPLIIEPALPAFGNVGDRMDLSAVLHNNTGEPVELEVRASLDRHAEFLPEAEGLVPTTLAKTDEADRPDLRVRRITLPAGASGKVGFPALFTRKGEAAWTWTATSVADAKLTDAVESKLEIGYPMPILRETHSFTLTGEGAETNLLAAVEERLLTGRGEVRVTLSNSRVAEALDAIDYLLHYPYGCVEQTTSSTLPWLTTRELRDALPQWDRDDAEIASAIAAGTRRLLSMQTRDGGLSYWPGGDQSMLWGSAYGGIALAMAEKQDVELPAERLESLWKYLSTQLRDTAKITNRSDLYHSTLAAYTLALAGRSEPAYLDLLYQKRSQLSPDSRALLALAIMETAGENRDASATDRVTRLLDRGAYSDEENGSHWYRRHFSTAMELLAWSRWDATGDRADALLDELLGVPRGRAAWGSTYLNSWGLLAVTAHARATVSALEDTVATVRFGEESREIAFGKSLAGELVSFDFEQSIEGRPLSVLLDSDSRLYAHLEVAAQPDIVPRDPENHGLAIERTYHRLGQDGRVSEIRDPLEVGDLVLVTLHLNVPEAESHHYLAIDDPMPSVFEAVNPNFETQGGAGRVAFKGDWKHLYCNHRELRTERALFFCDYLHRGGHYAVQYLARVVAPGEVTASPAKVEAMYEPQRYGLSGTVRVIAEPLKLPGKNRVAQH